VTINRFILYFCCHNTIYTNNQRNKNFNFTQQRGIFYTKICLNVSYLRLFPSSRRFLFRTSCQTHACLSTLYISSVYNVCVRACVCVFYVYTDMTRTCGWPGGTNFQNEESIIAISISMENAERSRRSAEIVFSSHRTRVKEKLIIILKANTWKSDNNNNNKAMINLIL